MALRFDPPRAGRCHDAFVIIAVAGLVDGIGEKDTSMRKPVCLGSRWLGLIPYAAYNTAGGPCISAANSVVTSCIVPADEKWMVTRHILRGARLGPREYGYW